MERAFFSYSTRNLGDDVQTLAMEHLLGPPARFLDRDHLQLHSDPPVRLIANGWLTNGVFPPPPAVRPIYLSVCLARLNRFGDRAVRHLKSVAPIGCRDWHSMRWCEEREIPHYFASCLTILLDREIAYDPYGPVVCVDVNPGLLAPIEKPVTWLSHRIPDHQSRSVESRRKLAQSRLRSYQEASLVITNRLHVAMPCLGMEVPVIVVKPHYAPYRLSALPKQVRTVVPKELARESLDPSAHRYDVESWRDLVRRKFLDRLGGNYKTEPLPEK